MAIVLLALLGCDPVRSVQGRVLSQAQAGEPSEVAGADVSLVCPQSRELLAKTADDGGFSYDSIGYWPERCAIEASTFDGSHRPARRSIAELCRASRGGSDCLAITNADFTLPLVHSGRRRARLSFRTDDARVELIRHLGSREEVVCTGACDTEILAGEQRFSLRLRRTSRDLWSEQTTLTGDRTLHARFIEDTDPTWPSTLGTAFTAAGVGLLLYAGAKEERVPAIAGLSSLAVGLTLSIVWLPGMHSAEVDWKPGATPPRGR